MHTLSRYKSKITLYVNQTGLKNIGPPKTLNQTNMLERYDFGLKQRRLTKLNREQKPEDITGTTKIQNASKFHTKIEKGITGETHHSTLIDSGTHLYSVAWKQENT